MMLKEKVKNKNAKCFYFGFILSSLFIMTGCGTLLGTYIGKSKSRENKIFNEKSNLNHLQLSTLRNDIKLKIILNDSSIVEGSFKGLLYSNNIKLLPSINDTISIIISNYHLDQSQTKLKYLYAGIDSQHVIFLAKPNSTLIKMPISIISTLEDNLGNVYYLKTIKEIMQSGKFPDETHLLMSIDDNIRQLQITEIYKIIVKRKSENLKLTGPLIGLGIDLFILFYGLSN